MSVSSREETSGHHFCRMENKFWRFFDLDRVASAKSSSIDIVTEVILEKMEDLNAFLDEELQLEQILGMMSRS
jgi:hypothetical protein